MKKNIGNDANNVKEKQDNIRESQSSVSGSPTTSDDRVAVNYQDVDRNGKPYRPTSNQPTSSQLDPYVEKVQFRADELLSANLLKTANDTLSDFIDAVQREKRRKSLEKLSDREAYRISKSIALKGVSTVHNAGLVRSTLTPFDIPSLTDQTLFEQLKYASGLLSKNHAEEQYAEDLTLTGRLPVGTLLTRYLYSQMFKSGKLPVGDLSQLSVNHKERIQSYLRLITDRMFSMSSLPLEALPGIVAAFVPDGHTIDGSTLESAAEFIENGEFVQKFVDHLSAMEVRARERYITQSLLQPLYRNVLVNQSDFSWPSVSYLINAAATMCRWNELYSNKILHSTLMDEIMSEWRNDTTVGGFWPLRNATGQGADCNGVYALNILKAHVPGADDTPNFDFSISDDNRVLSISTPFGRIHRRSKVRNIYGDTVCIEDDFVCSDGNLPDQMGGISELQSLIALYAKLIKIKVTDTVDLSFISKYPEWSGLVFTEEGRSVVAMSVDELMPQRLYALFYFRVMLAVMNGDYVSTDVVNVFSEPNQADLTKGLVDSVEIYALIHKTLLDIVVEQLGIYRSSLEWADSAIWSELDKINMVVPAYKDDLVATQFRRTLSSTSPVVFSEDKSVRATRYYVDKQALSLSPLLANMCRALDGMQVLGECHTVPINKVVFKSNVDTLVDVSDHIASLDIETDIKSDMLSNLHMMKVDEIYDTVRRSRRDVQLNIYSKRVDDKGRIISGFSLTAKFKPYIHVVFSDLSDYEQIPLTFIDNGNKRVYTSEDFITLPEEIRLQVVPIDPSPFIVIKHDVAPLHANVPSVFALRRVEDVTDYIRQWSHEVGRSFTSEDFPNGFIFSDAADDVSVGGDDPADA